MASSNRPKLLLSRWILHCKYRGVYISKVDRLSIVLFPSRTRTRREIAHKAPPRDTGDLEDLSALGHFLKGSSATLGLTKIKDCCEKIQHYGHRNDEGGSPDNRTTESQFLAKIETEVALARQEYTVVEAKLRRFFGEE